MAAVTWRKTGIEVRYALTPGSFRSAPEVLRRRRLLWHPRGIEDQNEVALFALRQLKLRDEFLTTVLVCAPLSLWESGHQSVGIVNTSTPAAIALSDISGSSPTEVRPQIECDLNASRANHRANAS